MNNDILSQLNESQQQAVLFNDGPSLVIAGAGSGKTRVLTYKIAYLMQQGMKPWNILALTFTNKAAREMKERIGQLVGIDQARYLNMGTFHSVFARILRTEAQAIGYDSNFTIYDQADSRSLVKAIIKEMQLDDKVYKHTSVADRISMAKNHLILPSQYATGPSAEEDVKSRRPAISTIYQRYAERCRQANAMDFDDLLVNMYVMLRDNDDLRRKYSERFAFILVDEYQDTNFAQQAIVYLLASSHQRVCVVGDDAQSIYSFRGANIDNILNFTSQYSGARTFKLEQNYRSTQHIVQAANSLIRKNERQIPKDVYSRNEHGEKLLLKPAYSDKEEAIIVCRDIERLRREDHCSYSDFAILYRTNSQSRSFEEQMRKDGIPYRIYGGLSFYQRKEIKDVIAYFRLVANHNDEEALRRIINYPARGIGDTTVQKVSAMATQKGVSLWAVASQPDYYALPVSTATKNKLMAFCRLISQWAELLGVQDAYTLGHNIIMESGISKDIYSSTNPDDVARQENLEELVSGMKDFVDMRQEEGLGANVSLTDYLQEVALMTDLDSDADADSPKVALMTVHSAKGLEFPTVFVVGLEENIFPSPMSSQSVRELEEERRLLYVAITRAEKHCILTCAQNRFRYGRMEFDTPSRFIRDIDPKFIQVVGDTPESKSFGGPQRYGDSGMSRMSGGAQRFGRPSEAGYSQRMQNRNPVASQFKADPMPRITENRPQEKPVDPFSDSFKRTLQVASGGRFVPVKQAVSSQRGEPRHSSANSSLRVGNIIEHQRFGRGTIISLEGSGEEQKATVEFRNAGTKQLLLKFAKFTIVG